MWEGGHCRLTEYEYDVADVYVIAQQRCVGETCFVWTSSQRINGSKEGEVIASSGHQVYAIQPPYQHA